MTRALTLSRDGASARFGHAPRARRAPTAPTAPSVPPTSFAPFASLGPIVLRAECAICGPFAAAPGDLILVRPGAGRPVVLQRELPEDYAALRSLVAGGALNALETSPTEAARVLRVLALSVQETDR
ncbi:hypothetical protein J421_0048 [Gemmatirosa kalamazoonensis]|uniref:Uncharacterized protein n=1 Tax=Gemmatirosa kalamazoonensis TaxID=861299 RepID=W0RB93_9BACT|nr:hypothetical protein [Gemmatirosa kalamazoonensis]AHG87541.1 hypothetical protein J421_0003 [Gemmatirosa kalamazoonensis]AHG87564.1 hypothetical protein J421_0026 [Gemmatirosa kalamazoonensis]AHG87585.1 hypothetical protein J421_0048 [Gemmatirosa kalamazoonensis]